LDKSKKKKGSDPGLNPYRRNCRFSLIFTKWQIFLILNPKTIHLGPEAGLEPVQACTRGILNLYIKASKAGKPARLTQLVLNYTMVSDIFKQNLFTGLLTEERIKLDPVPLGRTGKIQQCPGD
jgi:hypothetical protein